jgi:hypothetical protein
MSTKLNTNSNTVELTQYELDSFTGGRSRSSIDAANAAAATAMAAASVQNQMNQARLDMLKAAGGAVKGH